MTDISPNFPTGNIANPNASAAIDAESERTLFSMPEARTSDTFRWDTPSTEQGPQEPKGAPEALSTDKPEQLDIFNEPITQESPVDEVGVRVSMLAAMAVSNEIKARNAAEAAASGRKPITAETQSTTSTTAAGKFLRAKHAASKRK